MMQHNLLLIMISSIFLIFKSFLFWINLVLSVILFGPVAFLFGIVSYKICLLVSKVWCKYNLYFLKIVCSLSYELSGKTLDSHKIVISKHQSAWETIFLAAHVSNPIFILKKELLMIPIFGWCLYLLDNISIDRSDGAASLKKIMNSCRHHIENNKTIIIFPEGTRLPYGSKTHIKKGILKILESLKISSLLLHHNAGKYWQKNSYLIKPGVIKVHTLSLDYDNNLDLLKKNIENHFNM